MTAITDQRASALKLANERRAAVAEFKRECGQLQQRIGALRVADTLERHSDDEHLGAIRTRHLLMAINHIGETKCCKLLTAAGIFNYDKRLRDLTGRQRLRLAALLRGNHWH